MLRHQTEPAPADWLDLGPVEWQRTTAFGPAGFEAYARLRFLPDPDHPGQSESDVANSRDLPDEEGLVRRVVTRLSQWTTTPDDAYFCLWDGWGLEGGMHFDSNGRRWRGTPAFPREILDHPAVVSPFRSFHLFRGPLAQVSEWGAAEHAPGSPWGYLPPAFVWPADRAWCYARDVDPHWAGIGGPAAAIAALCAMADVDVVPADRYAKQPYYG